MRIATALLGLLLAGCSGRVLVIPLKGSRPAPAVTAPAAPPAEGIPACPT